MLDQLNALAHRAGEAAFAAVTDSLIEQFFSSVFHFIGSLIGAIFQALIS